MNVGEVLAGKYRVDRILGIGGMGMVVAATHLDLDQKVALKFMLPSALASEPVVERFLREAKAAVRLRGEHVCRVLDVGRLETAAPYIVMELLEGLDLDQLIRQRGALALHEAVGYLLQALEGVAEAHANDIVHRDLKPGNLFITSDNDGSALVKVLDFGISKSSLGGGSTRTGDIMGTPAYMAPEQMASSKNVDGRADIWALGVILYQVVTGRTPFQADTLPALCMAVMQAPPPPLQLVRPDLPGAFRDVVQRCLEKLPEHRFASVAELAFALAPFGPGDAMATATRIGKVLRRSQPALAHVIAPTVSATPMPTPTPMAMATPMPPAMPTTMQGSAAQVTPAPKRGRGGLVVALATAIAAAAIAVVVVATRGDGEPVAATATAVVPPPPPADAPPPGTPTRSPEPVAVEKLIEKPVDLLSEKPAATETRRAPPPTSTPKSCSPGLVLDRTRGCVAPRKADAPSATKTAVEPVETKPVESKPVVETRPVETRPVETRPVETKPQQPNWHVIQRDRTQKVSK